jgi:choline dehydrogenase-like flavoprotein
MLGRGRVKYLPKVSLAPAVQREKQVLNCVGDLVYDYDDGSVAAHLKKFYYALKARRRPRDIGRSGLHLLRHLDQVAGVAFQRYLRGRLSAPYPRHVRLQIWLEQAPSPMSRVTLSDERDVLGLRKARVDWRLSELERRTARTMLRTVDAELGRLGIARLSGTEWLDEDDWAEQFHEGRHHMGTTRMADSPEDGVVDVNCRVHDVDGLYVCGSSVFPSSGYANPTLTILAMAVRLADHLKREARR